MRVLYLTHHLPWPTHSGGRLREAELLRRLAPSFDIEVVAVSKTPSRDRLALGSATTLGLKAYVFGAIPKWKPFNGPLVGRHYSVEASRHVADAVERRNFGVVHVEGHYLMDVLPPDLRPRAVLVEHNVESNLFVQRVRISRTSRERLLLRRSAALTRRDEIKAWRTAGSIVAVTEADARAIRRRVPTASVHVVPNGFDHLGPSARPAPEDDQARIDLMMAANFAYQPSEDAALRLLTSVFPLILEERQDATLALVGNSPSTRMREAAGADPRITITGPVTSMGEWLDRARVVVCPLRIGGGIKVKVMEALARGRAVVTTPIGNQGLEQVSDSALIVRDEDESIAAACVHLLRDPDYRRLTEKCAREWALSMSTWDDAAEMLASCWLTGDHETSRIGVQV